MEKQCTKCNEVKSISEFGVLRGKVGGMPWCKVCNRNRGKVHFIKNKDEILKQSKIYYQENKEWWSKHNKEYFQENKETIYQRNNYNYNNNPDYRFSRMVLSHLRGVKNRQEFLDIWGPTYKMYDEKGIPYDIDHKVPQSWFLVRTPKYLINNLDNLHVIDRKYNRSKLNRWSDPVPSEYLDKIRPYIKKKFEGLLKSL